jgi:hypothetical protein
MVTTQGRTLWVRVMDFSHLATRFFISIPLLLVLPQ